jgi:hypothetical protein
MYISFFFVVICFMYIQALPSPRHVTESRLCMVLVETTKNAWSHITYPALQLSLNFIIFQTTYHSQFMMK